MITKVYTQKINESRGNVHKKSTQAHKQAYNNKIVQNRTEKEKKT